MHFRSNLHTVKPLLSLETQLATMPDALARAAVYILENPEKVVGFSLKELSLQCSVGEASIMRLCKIAGSDGFAAFKLALASELAVRRDVGTTAYPKNETQYQALARELSSSVLETMKQLSMTQLCQIASKLSNARRINLFGSGVSGITADLFAYRFLRSGLNATAIRDITHAKEISNILGTDCVAVAISESGTSLNTIDFLRMARLTGSYCLAVTCNERSPLAREADDVILMARLKISSYGGYINGVPRAVLVAETLASLV